MSTYRNYMSGLEIIEIYNEIKRLELDLLIHEGYRLKASNQESKMNEYMIVRTKEKLSQLYKSSIFEK
jgi:hypothetical protein